MAANGNPLQPLLDQIPKPFRNRYFLVLVLFFAWMVFVDKHDVLTQWRLQKSVKTLEADMEYYKEKVEEAKQDRLDLEINREKFAREKYYMKKKDEDVFIIVEE